MIVCVCLGEVSDVGVCLSTAKLMVCVGVRVHAWSPLESQQRSLQSTTHFYCGGHGSIYLEMMTCGRILLLKMGIMIV